MSENKLEKNRKTDSRNSDQNRQSVKTQRHSVSDTNFKIKTQKIMSKIKNRKTDFETRMRIFDDHTKLSEIVNPTLTSR